MLLPIAGVAITASGLRGLRHRLIAQHFADGLRAIVSESMEALGAKISREPRFRLQA
jgi:hypothetical protein